MDFGVGYVMMLLRGFRGEVVVIWWVVKLWFGVGWELLMRSGLLEKSWM
jgi:hypothetical protein